MNKHLNFSQVIVKMDSQVVFASLHLSHTATSHFAMLIVDCQMLTTRMDNKIFSFAKQYAKSISHTSIRASCSLLMSQKLIGFLLHFSNLNDNMNAD